MAVGVGGRREEKVIGSQGVSLGGSAVEDDGTLGR